MHMCGVCECVGGCEGFDVRESTTAFKEPPHKHKQPLGKYQAEEFLSHILIQEPKSDFRNGTLM